MISKRCHIFTIVLLSVVFFQLSHKAEAQAAPDQERMTLMQYTINERPVLAELLTTAGLAPYMSGTTDYTLLMPPEESLRALQGQSPEKIKAALARHLIKGRYSASDFKEGGQIQTYSGQALQVCRKKQNTLLNGVAILSEEKAMRNGIALEVSGML